MNSNDQQYQDWLQQRRSRRANPELVDRVLAAVTRTAASQPASRLLLVLAWIDRSRLRRVTACSGALLVGSVPFAYLAYISKAFIF